MTQLVASSTFEKIKAYHLDESIVLSEHDEQVRVRWLAAFTMQLKDMESDRKVSKMLMETFKISETQSYRDIANSRNLYGDIRKSSKEGLRYLVTQWAIEMLKEAKKEKDFKAQDRALLRITRANNLDMDDMDIPDPSKIQPPMQILSVTLQFIDSPYFKFIDQKAQEKLLDAQKKLNEYIEKLGVKEYLDITMLQGNAHKETEE